MNFEKEKSTSHGRGFSEVCKLYLVESRNHFHKKDLRTEGGTKQDTAETLSKQSHIHLKSVSCFGHVGNEL